MSGGGVTFIDRLRRWPLLACVRGGSGDARGGPGEPSGVENEPPGRSKSSLRRSQLGFRKPNVVSTRSKLPSPKRSRGEAPPSPETRRSRGEAPPSPATRRPSKTSRWRDANGAPLQSGKAPSARSPTKCGDELIQRDGEIVARQCGPRWCVVGAKPRQILAIVATLSGGMATWRCGSSVKRRNGRTRNVARPGILTRGGGVGAEPYKPTRTEARQIIEAAPSPTNCKNQAKPHRAR